MDGDSTSSSFHGVINPLTNVVVTPSSSEGDVTTHPSAGGDVITPLSTIEILSNLVQRVTTLSSSGGDVTTHPSAGGDTITHSTSGIAFATPTLFSGDPVISQQVNADGVLVNRISIAPQPSTNADDDDESFVSCCSLCPRFTRSIPFPKVGIKVSFFKEFIDSCGGREQLGDLTTTDVCNNFVKPRTESSQESYCNYLRAQLNENVQKAKVFVSHAWKYKFLDVVDALEYHFRDEPDTVLWFDLFSNNQHITSILDFNWWCGTFKSAIGAFRHTVMVMAPWNNPIPLTRGWCLFELYCTVATKSVFNIAMSKSNREQFFKDIENGVEKQINIMLSTINAENSECWKPEDRDQIFRAVKETVGFDKINSLVFEKMRDWVVEVTEVEFHKQVTGTPDYLMFQGILADLYYNQGRYDDALPLYSDCHEKRKRLFGDNDTKTLDSLCSLARVHQAKYESLILESELLKRKKNDFIRNANNYDFNSELKKLNSMASTNFQKSLSMCKQCVISRKSILGTSHNVTLETSLYLASLLILDNHRAEAESILLECHDISSTLSDETVKLETITTLALFYLDQVNTRKKGWELLQKSLELHKDKLKSDHPKTLKVMFHIGVRHSAENSTDDAEKWLLECFQRQFKVLGSGHLDTKQTREVIVTILKLPKRSVKQFECTRTRISRRYATLQSKNTMQLKYTEDLEMLKVIEKIFEPLLKEFSLRRLLAPLLSQTLLIGLILFHFAITIPLFIAGYGSLLALCIMLLMPAFIFLLAWSCCLFCCDDVPEDPNLRREHRGNRLRQKKDILSSYWLLVEIPVGLYLGFLSLCGDLVFYSLLLPFNALVLTVYWFAGVDIAGFMRYDIISKTDTMYSLIVTKTDLFIYESNWIKTVLDGISEDEKANGFTLSFCLLESFLRLYKWCRKKLIDVWAGVSDYDYYSNDRKIRLRYSI